MPCYAVATQRTRVGNHLITKLLSDTQIIALLEAVLTAEGYVQPQRTDWYTRHAKWIAEWHLPSGKIGVSRVENGFSVEWEFSDRRRVASEQELALRTKMETAIQKAGAMQLGKLAAAILKSQGFQVETTSTPAKTIINFEKTV